MNPETKICQNCKKDFVIEAEDFDFYKKINVPPPTFCWLCRAQRRMAWRTERGLYRRKSDHSGEIIFARFSPESPVKVYEHDFWESDGWDPMEYGRDFDPAKPFIRQLYELMIDVPQRAKSIIRGVNSEYCNNFTDAKNCYMVFNSTKAEDSCYSNGLNFSRNCVDCSNAGKDEGVYDSFWVAISNKAFFSVQCESCIDIWFSKNCANCNHCIGCVDLRNKSYCIWNEQLTKEEYLRRAAEMRLDTFSGVEKMREQAEAFWLKFPNKFMEGVQNSNVSGSYVFNSKNAKNVYLTSEVEDVKFCQYINNQNSKDCYDHTNFGAGMELTYENISCGNGLRNIKFCLDCFPNLSNAEFCISCRSSSDLFGCVALKNKKYCILNKQYSKEDYEALVAKIKKQMDEVPYIDNRGLVYRYGEFFPIELSPWAYNETVAQEQFPLEKQEAFREGYHWLEMADRGYKPTILAKDIPDAIGDVPEDITKDIIECAHSNGCSDQCTKAYRIIPQELAFYKQMNLPLPRLCYNCRHARRIAHRQPLRLYSRSCQCDGKMSKNEVYENNNSNHLSHRGDEPCPNTFETSYAPDRPEIVYCEQCYNAEVV